LFMVEETARLWGSGGKNLRFHRERLYTGRFACGRENSVVGKKDSRRTMEEKGVHDPSSKVRPDGRGSPTRAKSKGE